MASYNRIKAQKAVPIGTIVPWTGSASTSALLDEAVPNGYLACRGQTVRAIDYPLLAQLLGNAYGPFQEQGGPPVGIQNSYPNYTETDVFVLPSLNNTSLVDLEESRLDPSDQFVVGEYITENGNDAAPLSNVVSYIDVNFQVEPDSLLSGKITGVSLQEPAYFDTYRTIPRKLGVDHTPPHTHPRPTGDNAEPYPSSQPSGRYIAFFIPGNYVTQDNEWTTADSVNAEDQNEIADRFNPGTVNLTWYDPNNQSLPTMDTFHDFVTETPVLPASRSPANARNISPYGQTLNSYADDYSCLPSQQAPAIAQKFPPSGNYQGLLNYYPGVDVSAARNQGTYPVTLNHNTDSWNSTALGSHNHFTIDLTMTLGQMRVPGTILINNMTTGTIAPVSVDKALSVQINPNTPSLTTLVVIRAF